VTGLFALCLSCRSFGLWIAVCPAVLSGADRPELLGPELRILNWVCCSTMLPKATLVLAFFLGLIVSPHVGKTDGLPPSDVSVHFGHSDGGTSGALTPSDSFYQKLTFYGTKCALPYALLTLDSLISKDRSSPAPLRSDVSRAHVKKSSSRLLILLLLLLSGNVNINSGPECLSASLQLLPTPNEFSCRQGLVFLHVNARSLVPTLDVFKT